MSKPSVGIKSVVFTALSVAIVCLAAFAIPTSWLHIAASSTGTVLQPTDDAVLSPTAPNGRIFYSDGQNASSSIISFLPGGSPGGAGTNLGRGFQPAVSPDGTKVAFVDNTAGAVANGGPIMLMNPDGTNRRALPNPATGFTPAWSPDGNRLAYVVGNDSGGSGGSGEIWVMDLTPGFVGTNPVKIPNTRNAQAPHWGVNNFLVWWSRDGVFGIAKLGPVPPTSQIATGSPLPTRLPGVQTFDVEPVWSPDATKIAFNSVRDYPSGGGSEIYTMDANGGSQTRVTNIAGSKASPTWAPDGTAIAFEHDFVLKKVNPNGSDGGNPPSVQTSGFIYNRLHWAAGAANSRVIRAVDVSGTTGQQVVVSFELNSLGDEAGISFSVNFDPAKLSNPVAAIGSGAPSGAAVGTNVSQAASGMVGVLVDSTTAFAAGNRQMFTLRFNVLSAGASTITFGNTPTVQSVTTPGGALLTTTYQPGNVNITAATVTNGKLAYQQGGRATSSIYTITPGTGISTGLRRGFHPAYSPDGTKIVFTDNTAGATDGFLMIMNANDPNSARQLATPRQGFTPTWSPDGSRLAFIRGDFNSVGDNGKGQIYIIDMTQGNEGGDEVLIPTGTRSISKPSWGSTNRIVAACYDPFSGGGIDPRGVCVSGDIPATPQAITANPPTFTLISGQNTNDREATWAPSGSRIAFISTRDYPMANASEIYSANPDGTSPTRLSNTVDFKSQPTWSPDGTRIAYSRGGTQGPNNAVLRSVNADGSNATTPATITAFGSGDVFPNWGAAPAAGNDLAMLSMTDDTDPVAVGSNYNYVFSIKNNGTAPATGVKIVFDPVPNFPDAVSVHPIMLNCSTAQNRSVTCTFPNLAAGATVSQSVTFRAIQSASITMRATVSATEPDPNQANNSLTQSTAIALPADVALADPVVPAPPVIQGTVVFYTLKVVNYGPAAAQGLRLSVTLPSQLQYVEPPAPNGCTLSGNTLTCTRTTLTEICSSPLTPSCVGWTVQIPLLAAQVAIGTSAAQTVVNVTSTGSPDNSLFNNTRTIFTEIRPVILLKGLEVTQAVQNLKNDTPLVAGRRTIVRAHVKTRGTAVSASATLTARNTQTGAVIGTIGNSNVGGTINITQNPNREVLNDSFYFELPRSPVDWTQAANVELAFGIAGQSTDCGEPDSAPDCRAVVEFKPRRPFSIRLVLTSTVKPSGEVVFPTGEDVLHALTEIASHYPITGFGGTGGVRLKFDVWANDLSPCTIANMGTIRDQLVERRGVDLASGPTEDIYIALLPESKDSGICPGGTQSTGKAAAFRESFALPSVGIRNGNTDNVNVVMARAYNSRAHELGHNFGLNHTCYGSLLNELGCQLPSDGINSIPDGTISLKKLPDDPETFYGFDVYRDKITGNWAPPGCTPANTVPCGNGYEGHEAIYAPNTPDTMSYGAGAWISSISYRRIFESLEPVGSRTEESLEAPSAGRYLQVNGSVNPTADTGVISAVSSGDLNGSLPAGSSSSGWSIVLKNAQGAEIGNYPVSLIVDPEISSFAAFSAMMPFSADARSITLLHNAVVKAVRQASANAPAVTVITPNGGETFTGSTATVTWTASDQDGDVLRYSLDYSIDGGTTWQRVTGNLNSNTYNVDLSRQPGSNQALFRVTASDGFYSTEDRSNAVFTTPPHGPTAAIVTPSNNSIAVGDQLLSLSGIGFDSEEGVLDDNRLTWSSSLNGNLGTGQNLNIAASSLVEGTHTITLTARDSGSLSGTATISLRVYRTRPNFPATIATGSTTLNFSSDTGSGLSAIQSVTIRNSGDGTMNWTAETTQPWIKIVTPSGVAPSNLDVQIDRTGLAAGTRTGTIILRSNDAANSPITITVSLTLIPPSTITGRVVSPNGFGLRNISVSLIDAAGTVRTAVTSSFGIYSFANVPNSQEYTVRATSKRYRFAPRTINPTGDLTLSDLVALE